jgi:N-acyl-D-amino-acid deacylase
MKKWLVLSGITILIAGFTTIVRHDTDPAAIKTAINKSLPLLQSSSHTFLINAGGCHSCHGQGIGGVAFALAKEKGFTIQDSILKEALDSINNDLTQRRHYLAQNIDPAAIVIAGGYDLWAFAANRYPSNKTRGLLAKNLMQRQRKDGSWVAPNARPPIEYYSFSATAMAVKGILAYLPAVLKTEAQQKLAKAKEWLMNTAPVANEEKIFQLLGLTWAQADPTVIQQQARKLLAAQHADGGWSQLDSLPSDAYATGQSLYALHQSGQLTVEATAYQKGIAFLLRTQQADGSWNVQTRSFPSVPYVDSGFPHGDNQFISAAGSNWATMALLLAAK